MHALIALLHLLHSPHAHTHSPGSYKSIWKSKQAKQTGIWPATRKLCRADTQNGSKYYKKIIVSEGISFKKVKETKSAEKKGFSDIICYH